MLQGARSFLGIAFLFRKKGGINRFFNGYYLALEPLLPFGARAAAAESALPFSSPKPETDTEDADQAKNHTMIRARRERQDATPAAWHGDLEK
jgi:hypothetical protein